MRRATDDPVVLREEALAHARDLAKSHQDAPEAEAAARMVPDLEVAADAAAKAERDRAAKQAAAAEAFRLAQKWTYQGSVDAMTSKRKRSAFIESENSVNFGFPYNGPQKATLTLRDHPTYGRDVIISIERGQFLCPSYTECRVRVRFDEAPLERWSAVGPSDNSTTTVFLRGSDRFRQKLRRAKVIRIQVPIYQEGEPMFEFQVGGFDNKRYSETR
jgi:hypothetical protein